MRKDKFKKFLMNPWTIGISTTLLGLIGTAIYDAINKQTILTTIKHFFVAVWDIIIKFINIEVKMWIILIIFITLILILWIISRISIYKEKNQELEFLKYTQDELLGFFWEWTWEKDYNGKYEIRNLMPICSKCKTPLILESSYHSNLKCLRCDEIFHWNANKMEQVKVLIYDNVSKGQYKI